MTAALLALATAVASICGVYDTSKPWPSYDDVWDCNGLSQRVLGIYRDPASKELMVGFVARATRRAVPLDEMLRVGSMWQRTWPELDS